ncbi:MAG: holo-ACP synthase [Bdellovibrionales bacterium]|nr:holo-ACP synthase [Bdellovibrionales bacterium]
MKIIGIGIDLEEIKTFQDHLDSKNTRFFERVFTKDEIEYCQNKPNPAQHYAARFCAKEAAVKAVSSITSAVITDFEIGMKEQKPILKNVHGSTNVLDAYNFMVSLSHAGQYAIAQVLVWEK